MAEVKPFKGLLYNPGRVGADLSKVLAPPYDVISDAQRDELYNSSDHNIIRLILGKSMEGDTDSRNKYTRAADLLEKWQKEEVLRRNPKEAFYVYLQEYEVLGRKHRRIGFLGLMKIADPEEKVIFPHEHTLAAPKEDRMNLVKQVKSNLSPIFSLYLDPSGRIMEILGKAVSLYKPVIDTLVDGERNALWVLDDSSDCALISAVLKDKGIFIADGHHRYEVARKYRDLMRGTPGYPGNAEHIMMYFADMAENNDLTVMATHRAVKDMPVLTEEGIKKAAGGYFDVTALGDLNGLKKEMAKRAKTHAFGFYGGAEFMLLDLKKDVDLDKFIDEPHSADWKGLDVSILHFGLFKKLLGVKSAEGNVTYVRDAEEAVELVDKKSHKGAFMLNPTRVAQLKAVAENGDMMPQKSTYFYPKLLTGLVINKF